MVVSFDIVENFDKKKVNKLTRTQVKTERVISRSTMLRNFGIFGISSIIN